MIFKFFVDVHSPVFTCKKLGKIVSLLKNPAYKPSQKHKLLVFHSFSFFLCIFFTVHCATGALSRCTNYVCIDSWTIWSCNWHRLFADFALYSFVTIGLLSLFSWGGNSDVIFLLRLLFGIFCTWPRHIFTINSEWIYFYQFCRGEILTSNRSYITFLANIYCVINFAKRPGLKQLTWRRITIWVSSNARTDWWAGVSGEI